MTLANVDLVERSVARNIVQPGLRPGRYLSLQERFVEWLDSADGRFVASWVTGRATALKRRGFTRYGMKALWESARFARDVAVGPNAGFKLNNDFTSRLARHLMDTVPELAGFFEVRELKA